MDRTRLASLILVAVGLGACMSAPGPSLPPPAPSAAGAEQTSPKAMGQLSVTIRWPRQVQLIPYSTNRIDVHIEDAAGALVAETSIPQPTGSTTTQTLLPVPAGDGLRVKVNGYQDALLVASGEAVTAIRVNERTPLAIHLVPAFLPTLADHAPNGGVGALVALTGTHFGQSRNVPIQVTFGGIPASAVYRTDDEHLSAIVPSGFESGPIVVHADGIASAPSAPFTVIRELSPLGAAHYALVVGATVGLGVTASSSAGALAEPYLEWSLVPLDLNQPEQAASASFSVATGSVTVLTALSTGSALLRVRTGALLSTASVTVTAP